MTVLRATMVEYLENGVRLGWRPYRKNRTVEVYRLGDHQAGRSPEILAQPDSLSGESVIPEFELDLSLVW